MKAPESEQWEAIVVGGGPAGSTAARRLASAGVRTLVIEKATHPRYKVCGGGIPLRAAALLERPVETVVEDVVEGIEVSHLGRRGFRKRSKQPLAYMVMRDRFDNLLMDWAGEAGAEVHQGETVQTVEPCDGGAQVISDGGSYHASMVLGADGATGRVARAAGVGQELATSAAWELEVAAPAAALRRCGAGRGWQGLANVDVGYRPWGYGWVFPKAGRLSVGLVLAPGDGRGIRARGRDYLQRLGLADATITEARGHPIRYRRGRERIAAGPTLLLGDAAGLADEFTAEGIAYAVQSGRLAASAVVTALGSDGDAAGRYEAAVNREIQPELDAARAISRMYYWCVGTWPALALAASRRIDYFWRAFFRVMQGRSTYAEELRRWPGLAQATRLL